MNGLGFRWCYDPAFSRMGRFRGNGTQGLEWCTWGWRIGGSWREVRALTARRASKGGGVNALCFLIELRACSPLAARRGVSISRLRMHLFIFKLALPLNLYLPGAGRIVTAHSLGFVASLRHNLREHTQAMAPAVA